METNEVDRLNAIVNNFGIEVFMCFLLFLIGNVLFLLSMGKNSSRWYFLTVISILMLSSPTWIISDYADDKIIKSLMLVLIVIYTYLIAFIFGKKIVKIQELSTHPD